MSISFNCSHRERFACHPWRNSAWRLNVHVQQAGPIAHKRRAIVIRRFEYFSAPTRQKRKHLFYSWMTCNEAGCTLAVKDLDHCWEVLSKDGAVQTKPLRQEMVSEVAELIKWNVFLKGHIFVFLSSWVEWKWMAAISKESSLACLNPPNIFRGERRQNWMNTLYDFNYS